MNQIIRSFLDRFDYYFPILPQSNLVLGVSGGQDSMTLLTIIRVIKSHSHIKMYIVYCNHLWISESIEIEYGLMQFNYIIGQELYQAFPFKTVSTELQSRIWRYTIFQRLAFLTGTKILLTGHTISDQLESFFMNLIQGTGLRGVITLTWKRENYWPKSSCFSENKRPIFFAKSQTVMHNSSTVKSYSTLLIRPLLAFNRYETAMFIRLVSIPIWIDQTNLNTNYIRNRIRNLLLPNLRFYFNPSLDSAIIRYLQILKVETAFLDQITNKIFLANSYNNIYKENTISYSLSLFLSVPEIFQKRLILTSLNVLKHERFSNLFVIQTIKLILATALLPSINAKPQIFLLSKNLFLIFFKNKFYFKKRYI